MLRISSVLAALVLMAVIAGHAAAAGKQPVYATPEAAKADPDFAIQGEYVGHMEVQEKLDCGIQVIAQGGGKFHSVGYEGGLPGAGWKKTEKMLAAGEAKDGVATLKVKDAPLTMTIKDGQMMIAGEGKTVGALKRIERRSPTLGAKPPEGAIVLFDGKSAAEFDDAEVTKEGVLGVLRHGAFSKRKFQSCTAHVEFRTPFKPYARGQDRGNSGLYLQGRYETQILDSFGLEPRDNECGGIYSVAAPKLNMTLPPLAWQTYDVDFTAAEYQNGKKVKNARMTVWLNGVEVHKDVEVPHATTAAPVREGPQAGPIYLQNHGNPVTFRNIWVVEKK